MRILFLSDNFPPETNAAATRVYERARYWVEWGHEVTVITSCPNFPEGKVYPGYKNSWYHREEVDGIDVIRVKTFIAANKGVYLRIADFMSFMSSGFLAGVFQKRPDIVVATSPQFFAAVGGYALAKAKRVPFVFELSDLWPASIRAVGAMNNSFVLRRIEALELFLYQKSAAIVALTEAFKDDLTMRGIPEGKIAVVLNGVDLDRYRPMPRNEELAAAHNLNGHLVVGYLGTHGLAHALENVLDAADLMRDEHVRFLLVGNGAARDRIVEEAERRQLDNVLLLPPQPKESMPDYWSLCDVALVHLKDNPVFRSVIPSKIFEAMGMGLPILLASPPGEAKQIVERESAGLWVPAEEPAALVDAVLALASDRDMLRRFARNSTKAAKVYTRERQARDMIAVLEKVLAGEGAQAAAAVIEHEPVTAKAQ
jgi:colanic acid biosynthesis glycosyl transferase WcaI